MFSPLFYLAFFLSGFSALVYELIWTRKLALIFGNTPYAVSTVLAIFFGGLAVGSWLSGKIISHRFTPIFKRIFTDKLDARRYRLDATLIYALIELGIGLTALATLVFIPLLDNLPLAPTLSATAILTIIFTTLPILLPSTILIGTTLPVMIALAREFSARDDFEETLGQTTAKIYAVNTLGGVLGVFLTAFFLIAFLGVNETLILAAAVNIGIGLTIFYWLRRFRTAESHSLIRTHSGNLSRASREIRSFASIRACPVDALLASAPAERVGARQAFFGVPIRFHSRLIIIAFFLSGAAALSLEVLFTRALILSFGSSTYSFATILTTFLLGIALGSALATRWLRYKKKRRNPLTLFSLCLLAIAAVTLVITPIIGNLPMIFLNWVREDSSFFFIQTLIFSLASLLIVPAAIFMGATFPLVVATFQQGWSLQPHKDQPCKAKEAVATVGSLYAINTLGGILGSLLAGFVFISLIGVQKSIILTALIYLLTGSILLWQQSNTSFKRAVLAVTTGIILLFAFFIPSWNEKIATLGSFVYFPQLKNQSSSQLRSQMAGRKLLFYKDGLLANVAVYEEGEDRFLKINGKADASIIGDLSSVLLIGHLPMLFAREPKNVLVVGFGAGLTLGAIETYPVERIDMVEIEPAVIEASRFFKQANHNALADPRVNLIINDGRNFLFKTKQTYDVISSEPSNPWISGIANLFTREFFAETKKHLTQDGVMLQWLHLYSLSPTDLRTILRTFTQVYPHVSAWTLLFNNDLLLVGSKKEPRLSLYELAEKLSSPKVKEDLARIGVEKPISLMRYFLLDKAAIDQISQEAPIHTDNHPLLEFSAPKSLWSTTTVANLKLLFKYRAKDVSHILPENPESEELARELLLRDSILSSSIVLEDSLDRSINLAEEAFGLNPEIPQLREFLAGLYFDKAEELFSQKRISDAGLYLTKTITAAPNHAGAHANLGAVYLTNGLLDQAKDELDKAIELAPNHTEPHINLAIYYQKIGEPSKAKESLKRVLELDPENKQAKELLTTL